MGLAYVARGVPAQMGTRPEMRDCLQRFSDALQDLPDLLRDIVRKEYLEAAEEYLAFAKVLEQDARATQAALRLALAQRGISSQLVDNMNAKGGKWPATDGDGWGKDRETCGRKRAAGVEIPRPDWEEPARTPAGGLRTPVSGWATFRSRLLREQPCRMPGSRPHRP